MIGAPKTPKDAIDLFRRHDPTDLYGQLEPWQQRELICIVRRVCGEIAPRHLTVRTLPRRAPS
jgi:hypothetical protein